MNAPRHDIDAYVIDTLMRDLVGHDRRPSAFLIYLAITAAAGESSVSLSLSELSEQTGLSRRSTHAAIRHLIERGLLEARKKGATEIPRYRPRTPWRT